jgi:hypothetical protein
MKRFLSLIMVLAIACTASITSFAKDPTRLDARSFKDGYQITTLHIGSEVEEITSGALKNLVNLREITVSENNPFYCSYGGCLYDKAMTELLRYPPALQGSVIPSTVVSIRPNALYAVPDGLKEQIKEVVKGQASENMDEDDVPGEHFIHTPEGVKWRQKDGTIISPNSDVMELAARIVNASSTGSMKQSQQLQAAFEYVANNIYYVRSNETPTDDWVKTYATQTLGNRTGNCYGYAAAFAYIAKGLGYESRVCTGTVTSSLGGRTPHAWTEVKIGNKWYIFDTEMQNAKRSGYYKQTYDSYPAGPLVLEAVYSVSF